MTSPSIFTSEQTAGLTLSKVPRHIAIIPDGNRRWAKRQEDSVDKGHQAGANVLIEIVKAAKELGVKTMTFYLFSTENWSRSQEEIDALMWLLESFLRDECAEMRAHGVRLKTIGNLSPFPKAVLTALEETQQATAQGKDIDMVFALNYGGRDEIRRAVHQIIDECKSDRLQKEFVTETVIASYLDTAAWGDPELLIRTSGEMRVSNFLLWQLSYTELYITDVLWPNFKPIHLLEAIMEYQKRERRLGGS